MAIRLTPPFKEFLMLMNRRRVAYRIIGGYAVNVRLARWGLVLGGQIFQTAALDLPTRSGHASFRRVCCASVSTRHGDEDVDRSIGMVCVAASRDPVPTNLSRRFVRKCVVSASPTSNAKTQSELRFFIERGGLTVEVSLEECSDEDGEEHHVHGRLRAEVGVITIRQPFVSKNGNTNPKERQSSFEAPYDSGRTWHSRCPEN